MEIINEIVMVETKKIKPYHRNPRKNDKTINLLVEIIPRVGFNVPLVLDKNNIIVKGHSRWSAAIKLGLEEIPCVYSNADAETIKLDRLADNKVQEFSLWDMDLLRNELASINLDFDLGDLGFNLTIPVFDVFEDAEYDNTEYTEPEYFTEENGNRFYVSANDSVDVLKHTSEQQPYITQSDIDKTIKYNTNDYNKCVCSECGNVMFILKT